MTNASSLFRSLIVYSICLPLAIIVGYLLATPIDLGSLIPVAILLALLTVPLFLRWHYPWMLLTWNMSAICFFLPGKPTLGSLLVMISFGISVLQYILNRQLKFTSVPMLTRPLLAIFIVVFFTMRLTGGLGLNALGGGDNVGGKRYIAIYLAIIGYFALTAVKIPPNKRKLYVFLFYGGALSLAIGNLAYIITPGLSFIFLIFPSDQAGINQILGGNMVSTTTTTSFTRLGGLSSSSMAIISLMLAFFGIRGFLDFKKWWRLPMLLALIVATFFGGFRSQIITLALTLAVMFYMEGLMRTHWMPTVALLLVLGIAVAVPTIRHMPLVVQRSLAFVPGLDIEQEVAENAAASTDWRVQMWDAVIPEIPHYLILGKGLGINLHDLEMMRDHLNSSEGQYSGSMLAGDYHNGPLSLIIPFGLFGVAAFFWFLVAGTKVLYRNYKFGDSSLLIVNRFLLAQFVIKTIMFFTIFGSFYGDLSAFTALVGLSIALNHGVAKPAAAPAAHPVFHKFKLAAVR